MFKTKRRKVFGGTAAVLLVAAIAIGGALAYYGGSGSGTASASAGHAPRAVTVTGSCEDCPIFPGQTSNVPIQVALTGPGNAHVGSVSLDTSQGSSGIGGLPVGCQRSWFDFTAPNPLDFPAGANVSQGSPLQVTGSLEFIESGTLQDACSDAELTIYLTASPS